MRLALRMVCCVELRMLAEGVSITPGVICGELTRLPWLWPAGLQEQSRKPVRDVVSGREYLALTTPFDEVWYALERAIRIIGGIVDRLVVGCDRSFGAIPGWCSPLPLTGCR